MTATTAANAGNLGNNVALYAGIRVYKRSFAGVETEITGAVSAIVYGSATGLQSATWTPPVTSLATTDSIVIKLYAATTTPPATLRTTFTTEQLGATRLDASQWTVSYFMRRAGNPQGGSSVLWGTSTYDSRVDGFQWTSTANWQNHNTLNWTHSGTEVSQYVIYRSAVSSGPWDNAHVIDTVTVGNNTYTDRDKGEADSTLWWYIVRAEDDLGNRETNTNSVQEPGGTPPTSPYFINLVGKSANSWVFVSFPSAMSGNIQTILNDATAGDGLTTWAVAKWFNIQTPNDPWKTYRAGSSVNDMPTLTNQMGVWIWITTNGGDQKLTLSSYVANSTITVNVNLYAGWNMVGYPTGTSRTESATLPAQADLVASWQAATPYLTQHAKGATLMAPGNAYWVHVTTDCTWLVLP